MLLFRPIADMNCCIPLQYVDFPEPGGPMTSYPTCYKSVEGRGWGAVLVRKALARILGDSGASCWWGRQVYVRAYKGGVMD